MKSQFIARKLLRSSQDEANRTHFPSLRQLAIEAIARNFELYPALESAASPAILEEIYSHMSVTESNVVLLAKAIDSEEFWKRACAEKFALLDSNFMQQPHGAPVPSAKQVFFETYFRRILNDPTVDADGLMQMAQVAGGLLRRWSIEEVTPKLEKAVFESLIFMEKLEHLSVTFACPLQETNFGVDSFRGLNLERAHNFESNSRLTHLRSLRLENNLIGAKELEVILRGLGKCTHLESLSLARNKLGDVGAEVAIQWVSSHPSVPLRHLDLSDNEIGYEGGRIVAEFLADPSCALHSLSLKVNFLNNQILEVLVSKLSQNPRCSLRSLNLSANLFGGNQFETLRALLTVSTPLEELHLDGNEISLEEDQVANLQTLITRVQTLKRFSLKFNRLKPELAAKLHKAA